MDPYLVSRERVLYIAKLASLNLDETEQVRFLEDLNGILAYMRQLNSLDTEQIEATFQTLPSMNVMREDIEEGSLPLPEILRNAPEKAGDFFKVPPILETS